MATSRQTATNESVSTYGSSGQGRDYTVFSTWESATDVDNVDAEQSPVLECYADASNYNERVYLSSSTNNATYFRIVRPAPGQFHGGITGRGVTFSSTHSTNHHQLGSSSSDTHSQIQDISLSVTQNSTDTRHCIRLRGENVKLIGVLVFDASNSGTGGTIGVRPQITSGTAVINCLISNSDDDGYASSGSDHLLYNCTIVNNGNEGVDGSGVTARNCLANNNSTRDFSQFGIVTTNNASSDRTAAGTGARRNQTFTFVDASNGDFHLANSDTGAKGFGANLSSDSSFAFDDDIDFQTVTNWSIGFDSHIEVASLSRATLLKVGK